LGKLLAAGLRGGKEPWGRFSLKRKKGLFKYFGGKIRGKETETHLWEGREKMPSLRRKSDALFNSGGRRWKRASGQFGRKGERRKKVRKRNLSLRSKREKILFANLEKEKRRVRIYAF